MITLQWKDWGKIVNPVESIIDGHSEEGMRVATIRATSTRIIPSIVNYQESDRGKLEQLNECNTISEAKKIIENFLKENMHYFKKTS